MIRVTGGGAGEFSFAVDCGTPVAEVETWQWTLPGRQGATIGGYGRGGQAADCCERIGARG